MRLLAATLFAVLALASPAFASGVSGVSITDAAPSNAAGARTVYVVGFTTSPTGALSQASGSHIDVTFDIATGTGGFTGATVRDVTSTTNVGSCSVCSAGSSSSRTIRSISWRSSGVVPPSTSWAYMSGSPCVIG